MEKKRLSSQQINLGLSKLNAWTLDPDNGSVRKEWEFGSFKAAMTFLTKVGELAELHDHHPELLSAYTNIRIRLWTHDANGLTSKDFLLALEIDQLVENHFSSFLKVK